MDIQCQHIRRPGQGLAKALAKVLSKAWAKALVQALAIALAKAPAKAFCMQARSHQIQRSNHMSTASYAAGASRKKAMKGMWGLSSLGDNDSD